MSKHTSFFNSQFMLCSDAKLFRISTHFILTALSNLQKRKRIKKNKKSFNIHAKSIDDTVTNN